jgi:hypothetical protein
MPDRVDGVSERVSEVWEVDLGRMPVRWSELGDAWDRHLSSLIRLGGSSTFGGSDEEATDHIEYQPSDWTLGSWMCATRDEEGWIRCVVYSEADEDEPREEQVAPWREAALGAAARVNAGGVATWNAVLGPPPALQLGGVIGADHRPVALAAETGLGSLRLVPGGVHLHEMAIHQPHLIGTNRFPYSSWPLVVEGTATCHGELPDAPVSWWPMDEHAALLSAQRAAALVTLVWNTLWIVRRDPVRVADGDRTAIPHLDGYHGPDSSWADGCTASPDEEAKNRQDRELPAWVGPAWTALEADPALAGALDAYYQAARIDLEHPSVAALMYS